MALFVLGSTRNVGTPVGSSAGTSSGSNVGTSVTGNVGTVGIFCNTSYATSHYFSVYFDNWYCNIHISASVCLFLYQILRDLTKEKKILKGFCCYFCMQCCRDLSCYFDISYLVLCLLT